MVGKCEGLCRYWLKCRVIYIWERKSRVSHARLVLTGREGWLHYLCSVVLTDSRLTPRGNLPSAADSLATAKVKW